jgi:hypothetical protein
MAGSGRIAEFHHVPGSTVARLFNFDIGRDWLKPEHQAWLNQNVVGRLRDGGSLWVMGLTSTTGPDAFNSSLSQKRAESVIAFLRKQLSKGFPVKLEGELALGELPARIAGLADNTENANWRAVVVSVWDKPTPPPPPPPAPPNLQEECKRFVLSASNGVKIYVFLDDLAGGRRIISQITTVKASPGYVKCATDFERKWSFLAGWPSQPVVYVYDPYAQRSDVVGEVVGHFFRVNRYNIVADQAALKGLPSPYNNNFYSLPLEALLNGYGFVNPGDTFVSLGKPVPLFLSYDDMPGYTRIAYSSEDTESYDVVTDAYGQIVATYGTQPSRYPKRESLLRVGIKAGVKRAVREVIKTIIFE